MAGATPRYVRLNPPDWKLDEAALRTAFSAKTKLIVLNSPMNPACKVFTRAELEIIARLLEEFDAYAVCDEVYEHMVYDGQKHIPLRALPGMKKRCLRIGSAGKTFSLTGWKVGYVSGPPELMKPVAAAHQNVTFATPPSFQNAVAKGLMAGDEYYAELAAQMNAGRVFLADALKKIGFNVLPCEGTYFLVADFAPLGFKGNDVAFCEWMTKEGGVTAIPMSAFYAKENGAPPRSLIRFCFAKKPAVLQEAIARMEKFFR
jgi:aspartate/methionine/tyrosine aminotransferase